MMIAGSKMSAGRVGMVAAMALFLGALPLRAADLFTKPTPEELAMTSLPGFPGAPAVILFREEITNADLHSVQHYERIKVLTEKGKEYANVELRFFSSTGYDDFADDKQVTDIAGRTIHPDGTIIPFTGKPYLKMMEKGRDFKYQARVFTLPDVEIGSIIEYRYAERINDNIYEAPDWYVQGDLYTKAAHFSWLPTNHELNSKDGIINTITWLPILPEGVTVKRTDMVGKQTFELTVHDMAPQPDEDYMPPIRSFSYRVLFNYTPFHSPQDFWKSRGKDWSKREDSFIGPSGELKSATESVIAGATTQDEKLRKIYAAVMALENTDYTRDRDRKEDKAEGVGKINNAGDVYKRGRGSSDQLNDVFIGMARAAGMKAYVMLIPDRSKRIFTSGWTQFNQFDNSIAIVNVDGKEQFFDPGQRYAEYGHLAWQNTLGMGIRQLDSGTDFAQAPIDNYTTTRSTRVANLTMDARGAITRKIDLTFTGAMALRWRHTALRGDDESLKTALKKNLEDMLPKTLEVNVTSIENLADYVKPLAAHFEVKGTLGTVTGKRMILPADVFAAENVPTFPHEKRELPVYFEYPQTVADAMKLNFPASMSVEAVPEVTKELFQKSAQFDMAAVTAGNSVTVRRNYVANLIVVEVKDYNDLRAFYAKIESKDKDSIVLKMPTESASNAPGGGN